MNWRMQLNFSTVTYQDRQFLQRRIPNSCCPCLYMVMEPKYRTSNPKARTMQMSLEILHTAKQLKNMLQYSIAFPWRKKSNEGHLLVIHRYLWEHESSENTKQRKMSCQSYISNKSHDKVWVIYLNVSVLSAQFYLHLHIGHNNHCT